MNKSIFNALGNSTSSKVTNEALSKIKELGNNFEGDTSIIEMNSMQKSFAGKLGFTFIIIFSIFYLLSFLIQNSIFGFIIMTTLYIIFLILSFSIITKSLVMFEIKNNKIYKSSVFVTNKFICNIDDILGYFNVGLNSIAVIGKNYKILFIASNNNKSFNLFLENKSKNIIFSKGIYPLSYVAFFISFTCLILIPTAKTTEEIILAIILSIIPLIYGLNEKTKYIYADREKILLKNFFIKKFYKYNEINKIIYNRNNKDAGVLLWKIKAYNKSRLFSYSHIDDVAFQKLLKFLNENNVKLIEKKKIF